MTDNPPVFDRLKGKTGSTTNLVESINLRNWVIYGYDKVDDGLIWRIVTNGLPKLKIQNQKLMSENDQSS